jgi:hypothetical protein
VGRGPASPAGPAYLAPAGPPRQVPRAGLVALACFRSPAGPRLPSPLPLPGWASRSPAQLGRDPSAPGGPSAHPPVRPRPRLGHALAGLPPAGHHLPPCPVGPDQEDPAWPGFPSRPPYLDHGWAGLRYSGWSALVHCSNRARPGFPGPGRIITLQGRYLRPPEHIPR